MTMKAIQVRAALEAGHRKFILDSGIVADVLRHGSNWVRFRTPQMKTDFLSVSMFLFSVDVKEIYTEKSPDAESGQ